VQSGTSLPELMELGGWKSYEMVLRYARLAPEKLSYVARRIERQPLRSVGEALGGEKNVAKNAYVGATVGALMPVIDKFGAPGGIRTPGLLVRSSRIGRHWIFDDCIYLISNNLARGMSVAN
jgi:hypothetical protein